jgi:CubicO group peptidase (beta-lactamase class C family)
MKMVEEKVIELDKPLESYLPQPVYAYGKEQAGTRIILI